MVGCADYTEDIQKVDDKLQNEVSDLTAAVSALQVKLAEDYATKQSVEALKSELNGTIASEVADLEKALDNATAALNAAINEKADEADLNAVEKTVADLQADLAEAQEALQTKLAEAKAALEAADAANAKAIEDLTVRVSAAEKAIENINAAVATLQSDVESLKQAYMENTMALTNLKNAYDKFQEETTTNITALQGNLAALEAYVEAMNEEINARIDVVAQAVTAVNNLLEDEVTARQIADEEIYAAIDVVSQAVSAVNVLLQDEAAEREAEDAAIYAALNETNTAISNVLVLLEDAKAELSEEFRAQIEVVSTAISSVYNQLNDLAVEVAGISDRLAAQEAAFEAHKEVIDAKAAELAATLESLSPVIATLQAQSAELRATLESLSPVIANIEAKIAELFATFESLSPVIENLDDKITELKNQMVSLEPVINNLNEQVTAMVALQERILSLAFIPEVIDTDLNEVIDFYTVLRYAPDPVTGIIYVDYVASNKPTVSYRVNPTQANLEGVEWSFIGRDAEIRTRAAGDKANFLSIVETIPSTNGEIKFVVETTTDLKDYNENNKVVDLVALQAQTEKYNIVSDFAAVVDTELDEFSIVNILEKNEPYFNVNWWLGIESADKSIYQDGVFYPAEETTALPVQLVHNESINLLEYVGTYCDELKDLLGAKYQIVPNYTFKLVDKFISSVDGVTNQQDFIVLEGDKVSVNLDFVKNATEVAIGKTPVVEVTSLYEGKEIAKAYIKIDIVEALRYKKEPVTYTVEPAKAYKYTELPCGQFKYDNASSAQITWVDLTQNILADTGIKLPNEGFVQEYDFESVTSKVYYTSKNGTVQGDDVKGVEIKTLPQDNTAATTTPVAAYAVNCDINSANGTGRVEITIPSKDVYVYPDVTIIFNFTVSHETDLPKLYEKYAANDVVVVKGHEVEADGFAWSFEEVLHEAFDKATYEKYGCQKNHGPLAFRLADPRETRAVIEPSDNWLEQVISLNNVSEVDWEKNPGIEIAVELYTTLCNGEECVFPYTVRFVNPFEIKIADVELETKLTATTADLLDYVTIYFDGEAVYENHAYTEYGVELGLVGVLSSTYEVVDVPANIAKQDGWLTCTEAGIITWNNGGTTLLANEVAHSHARAHLDAIGYFGAKGNVTFLATK